MDTQHKHWKREAELLAASSPFDHRQAAALVAEIARHATEERLRQAAAQALPGLRAAALKSAEAMTQAVARRRFGAVRDALHALDAPRFGKRSSVPAPEQQHRRLLGLPSGRPLEDTEIRQGYRRAARRLSRRRRQRVRIRRACGGARCADETEMKPRVGKVADANVSGIVPAIFCEGVTG